MSNPISCIYGAIQLSANFRLCVLVASGLLFSLCPTLAQDVISSPPTTPAVPAAVQEAQNNNPMQVFAPTPEIPSPVPLQWGPVTLHPHLDYQLSYGNGIQSAPGQPHNTLINQLSPGILINLGDHWTLDYTPTLIYYSSGSFQDALNQSVILSWGSAFGNDWFFNGSQSYTYTSNPEIETATQTDQQNFVTTLNASYLFNEKMSLDMGLNQNLNYIGNSESLTNQLQPLVDTKSWSTLEWLNYQFWPRFSAGLGLGFGYNQQEQQPRLDLRTISGPDQLAGDGQNQLSIERRLAESTIFERRRGQPAHPHF